MKILIKNKFQTKILFSRNAKFKLGDETKSKEIKTYTRKNKMKSKPNIIKLKLNYQLNVLITIVQIFIIFIQTFSEQNISLTIGTFADSYKVYYLYNFLDYCEDSTCYYSPFPSKIYYCDRDYIYVKKNEACNRVILSFTYTANRANGMFQNCDIITVDFDKFDMTSITNMNDMFNGCSSLTTVSNFKPSYAEYMSNLLKLRILIHY